MPSSLQTWPVSSVFHSVASCCASAQGATKSASFLSMTSYGSSVAGAPRGGGPGLRPRLTHEPRKPAGILVCAPATAGISSARSAASAGPTQVVGRRNTFMALLRLERNRLAVGQRHAEQQQLGLSVAARPSFERHLVAGFRDRSSPTLGFELTRRRPFDRPLLRGIARPNL